MKKSKIFLALFSFPYIFSLIGCATPDNSSSENYNNSKGMSLTSNIDSADCFLCGNMESNPLSLYYNQENVGLLNLNTFDIIPISINRYDDYGNLIQTPANTLSTSHFNYTEAGLSSSITPNSDRGYATGTLTFLTEEAQNLKKATEHLCSKCLDNITEQTQSKDSYSIGIIDFHTLEVHLLKEQSSSFSFGDYYISYHTKQSDDKEAQMEMEFLVFYCPERYPEQ